MGTLVIIVLIAAVWAMGFIARCHARNQVEQELQLTAFYDAAGILIDDRDTPDALIELLLVLSEEIRSQSLPWKLLFDGVRGRIVPMNSSESPMVRLVDQMPEHLRAQWWRAMTAFILASTLNSVLAGTIVRRLMLFSVERKQMPYRDVAPNVGPIITDVEGMLLGGRLIIGSAI